MDALEELLSEWTDRYRGKGFIRDGIIDVARWPRARRKVLLLLKEAYGEHEGEMRWDLCQVIREQWKGPKHPIWHQAASWCYAAQNTSDDKRFPTKLEATNALLHAAFLNIKKSEGFSASDDGDIRSHAECDGDLIKRQVEIIKPDIILCGNTWRFIQHLWIDKEEVYDMVWKTKQFTFIDFWHPANRFPNGISYYALVCLLQNGKT